MKKISIILLSLMVILNTGCLKDKGFENQVYGIKDPSRSPVAVGFNLKGSASYIRSVALDASGDAQAVNGNNLTIGYYASTTAPKDINVTVALDPTIIEDYNNTNGTAVEELPASAYSIETQNLVIKAGEQNTSINLNVLSTLALDISKTYALAFKIVSTDNGIQVASNMKQHLLLLNIKNQYDGRYQLDFTNVHPLYNPGGLGTSVEVEMWTSGPNSVKIYWPDAGGFYNPAILNNSLQYFASQEPEYTIDPVTNAVTVSNSSPTGTTVYEMVAGYDSHYDPTTKSIFAKWGYSAGTREWTQEFTYLGPR